MWGGIRARMTRGRLSTSAKKVYFKLRHGICHRYTCIYPFFEQKVCLVAKREELLFPTVLELKAFIKQIRLR